MFLKQTKVTKKDFGLGFHIIFRLGMKLYTYHGNDWEKMREKRLFFFFFWFVTKNTLSEKCPRSEFSLSIFSRIRTEYGEIFRILSKCGKGRAIVFYARDLKLTLLNCRAHFSLRPSTCHLVCFHSTLHEMVCMQSNSKDLDSNFSHEYI